MFERPRDPVQPDPLGHQRPQIQPPRPNMLRQHRQVPRRVGVAVHAAGQRSAPVEDLQRVEGDLLVLAADADDRRTAAAASGVPGRANGHRTPYTLDGDIDTLLPREGADLTGGGVGGDDIVRGARLARQRLLLRRDVHRDDLRRARDPRRLERREPDPARPEHGDGLTGVDPRRVVDGAVPGEDGAAEEGGIGEGDAVRDGQYAPGGHDGLLGERGDVQPGMEIAPVGGAPRVHVPRTGQRVGAQPHLAQQARVATPA